MKERWRRICAWRPRRIGQRRCARMQLCLHASPCHTVMHAVMHSNAVCKLHERQSMCFDDGVLCCRTRKQPVKLGHVLCHPTSPLWSEPMCCICCPGHSLTLWRLTLTAGRRMTATSHPRAAQLCRLACTAPTWTGASGSSSSRLTTIGLQLSPPSSGRMDHITAIVQVKHGSDTGCARIQLLPAIQGRAQGRKWPRCHLLPRHHQLSYMHIILRVWLQALCRARA